MMDVPVLLAKLLRKPGMRALLLNTPDELSALISAPEIADTAPSPGVLYDWVVLFARDRGVLLGGAASTSAVAKPEGVVWIAYPKKSAGLPTDLSRDTCWQAMETTGWRPVTQVAVDNVWSALRFRPVDLVKTKKR